MSSIQLRYTTVGINIQIGVFLAGSGSATILWGDSSSNVVTLSGTVTQTLHTYASANTYTVDISGANITRLGNGTTVATGIANLKSVISFGNVGLTSLNGAFRGASGLPNASGIMPSTLPGTVTNLDNLFYGATNFNDPSINGWDVSGVTSMTFLFNASAFNQYIGGWNVSKCTNFTYMFNNNLVFNNGGGTAPLNWTLNTTNNVSIANMFLNARAFNQDVSWNTTKVTAMSGVFQEARDFNRDITMWSLSEVNSCASMFQNAISFNNGDSSANSTKPLTSWNVSKSNNFVGMFLNATTFNQNVSGWSLPLVSGGSPNNGLTSMFRGATNFNNGGVDFSWNSVGSTPNVGATNMFYGCTKFNQKVLMNTTNIIAMDSMFYGATIFNQDLSWNTINVTNMNSMFQNTNSFNKDLSWNTINVRTMVSTFGEAKAFNGNISNWDTRNVTNMNGMFGSSTPGMIFNIDISNWNTGKVTDMTNLFLRDGSFNCGAAPGVSGPFNWDVREVTAMVNMFNSCTSFNRDISSWRPNKVTNMTAMFSNSWLFNQNLNGWDVSNVNNFTSMFSNAQRFNNGAAALTTNTVPLTWSLNTAGALKTINMTSMFANAYSFSQDISNWNIKNVSTMTTMFNLNTTSMTKDLFNAMLTKWGVTDPSVNVPKSPFTLSTIKYTSGGSAGLTALQTAPYSWTVTANLVSYSPTSVVSGSSFTFTYAVASVNPVVNRGYNIVNTNSPSTVLSTYVGATGVNTYTFTGVTIPVYSGYNSLMIIDASINAIVDVVQINGFYPCLKEGTKILTDKGYVPIENLRKGDLIKTPVNDYKAVYMIGKTEIYNHALPERETYQLYKCTPENYPEVFEDLILTGCHSILVDEFTSDEQREKTREVNGDLYVTRVNYGHIMGGKYRLPACADERAVVYEKEGPFTIYHIALENSNYYHNYGIYANGLLVETCSQRYLNELSHMDSVE